MNNLSENSTNLTYYTIDFLLTTYGSTWILDNLNLYLFTIVSIFGLFVSILSLLVFQDKEFNIPLYAYLRVHSINNTILSLISIFNFIYSSYRILSWSNAYWTQVYYNYIYIPLSVLSYFYSSALSVIILLDRISYFVNRVKIIFLFSPYRMSLVIFLICFIINFPFNFVFTPTSFTGNIDSNTEFTVWFRYLSSIHI